MGKHGNLWLAVCILQPFFFGGGGGGGGAFWQFQLYTLQLVYFSACLNNKALLVEIFPFQQQARVRRQPSLRVVRPKSEAEGEVGEWEKYLENVFS